LPCTEIDDAATETLADYKELALDLLNNQSLYGWVAHSSRLLA
jgi:hypothetical protein